MATINISTSDYRACIVNGKKALFHRWSVFAKTIGESPVLGGHTAGQIQYTVGIVEFEDGTVKEVFPAEIKFTDNLFYEYTIPDERGKRKAK